MKSLFASSLIGASLFVSTGYALAQDIVIAPEQETVIREYVKKKPLASIDLPGIELNIGSTLPETVEVHEIPNVKYRYVVVGGRTVLVEPETRKVVRVID